jgi:hypothetical protein
MSPLPPLILKAFVPNFTFSVLSVEPELKVQIRLGFALSLICDAVAISSVPSNFNKEIVFSGPDFACLTAFSISSM